MNSSMVIKIAIVATVIVGGMAAILSLPHMGIGNVALWLSRQCLA